MDCFERLLLNGCYRATYNPRNPAETRRALLICALLPNHRSLCDFQDAMYLLEANNNKATVLFSWQELKERQSSRLLHQLVALVHAQGHEIALHFNTDLCMQSSLQLRQDAVEALHFMQRVLGVNVTTVRVGYSLPSARAALETLGLTVFGEHGCQRLVSINSDSLLAKNVEVFLETLRSDGKRCVTIGALFDEIR